MAEEQFEESPNAKICKSAASVLLDELPAFAQTQKSASIEGAEPNEQLVLKLEFKAFPNIHTGEAQTLEVDKTLLPAAIDIFRQLGVPIDDNISVSQLTNEDGGVTFSYGTFNNHDQQTYRSHVEIKVDISKVNLDLAKRIAEEGKIAKKINAYAIGRNAKLDCNGHREHAEDYFALLKKELETAGLFDVLPPILESTGDPQVPFESIKINVAEIGIEDARILVNAMKSASKKLNNERMVRRDDEISKKFSNVPGMGDVPEHWKRILGALGCDVTSVQRMFGEEVHTVQLATPLTNKQFVQLADKLNVAANQVKQAEGDNVSYITFTEETGRVSEQPEQRLTTAQGFAAMFSYRMPQKTPHQPAGISKFNIGFWKLANTEEAMADTSLEPAETVDLIAKLAGYDWNRLAAIKPSAAGHSIAGGNSGN